MPPTTGTTEEIIEKKDSSPLGTSCLVLSGFALLGAIVLQLIQIGQVQKDLSPQQRDTLGTGTYIASIVQPAINARRSDVQQIVEDAKVPEEDLAEWTRLAEGELPGADGSAPAPGGLPPGLTPGGIDPSEIDPGALDTVPGEDTDLGDFGDFGNP